MEFTNSFEVLAGLDKPPRFLVDGQGKKFTKAGIIPFLPPHEADNLSRAVQQFNHKNLERDDCKETFYIFSQNISAPAADWSSSIPENTLRALESYNSRHLLPEHKYLAKHFIRPNDDLIEIMDTMWGFTHRKYFTGWKSLLCIEAVTSYIFTKSNGFWDRNNFSFFGGGINTYFDNNIKNAATREAREEGKLVFSGKIFSLEYQREMRNKYGLDELPPCINICVNEEKQYFSKTYLLFMENVGTIVKKDRKGGYLYVYPKY